MKTQQKQSKSRFLEWNLLICGPMVHGGFINAKGIGGALEISTNYNCSRSIIENIERWGHLFKRIMLVTWSHQEKLISPEIKSLGIDILLLEDPGQKSSFCHDNRIRVMTTTSEGIKAINSPNSHIIRIRSDQTFDLSEMIKSHVKASNIIRNNQILSNTRLPHISALRFWLDRPYALCNFAHAGLSPDLLLFAEAQIRYRHASALRNDGWPEGDSIRKHLLALMPSLKKHGFRKGDCFPDLPKSLLEGDDAVLMNNIPKDTLKLWEFSLKHIYSCSSKKATESLVWKDKKYPDPKTFGNGMRFYKNWKRCAKGDTTEIFSYCKSKFSSSWIPQRNKLKWTLHGKAEQVEGLKPSLSSKAKSFIQTKL